ncbi:AAA family ATPase [Chryseobacterium sp. Mn2064]|uniref:AAA family ATPase n=1 Tax=Chryseobacterium sp. Mn2064 TaxID=3395263 RepID=UPI003BC97404
MKKLCIITGGPGAGKTTLLNELSRRGFITVPEEGRRIIREQIDTHGEGLPWKNKEYFAELMFDASVKIFQKMRDSSSSEIVFFDRGIVDTLGYLNLENIPIPHEMRVKAKEMMYHKSVFILPPWKAIYENDEERKQTFEVAESTFNHIKRIYQEYSYNLVEVPKAEVSERADFILDFIRTEVF